MGVSDRDLVMRFARMYTDAGSDVLDQMNFHHPALPRRPPLKPVVGVALRYTGECGRISIMCGGLIEACFVCVPLQTMWSGDGNWTLMAYRLTLKALPFVGVMFAGGC
ncbi:MAG: hypothetical protein C7B45_12995 [Sulfobacillus acidophilus]|uniref:Uncharacterized protein n=1 Tax=Sulfobacillus acidophilus TaxID=53633 RepID=A0A2T2WF51_9FIRM|nr:MAG: hypothetical protein C7B45_12995 [Sulfobacillus acidophilus]